MDVENTNEKFNSTKSEGYISKISFINSLKKDGFVDSKFAIS
jgi:hypothetical protein